MSRISRRSLLGYSGTAAAGAVLASAGSAQADEAEPTTTTTTAAAEVPTTGEFWGDCGRGGEGNDSRMSLRFSVSFESTNEADAITALEIANHLNELAESRGWRPATFYYNPAPAPLN
ncbi:twin-arginine translocation signal domain-containing protein [Streptomyces sp. ME19-01-6]|uniref:twin-arginine translocation signal domain-containing protein n=1 Tax=Streptomyces sp. ME19-01-6 TaxID=3028686 RepID=UPI00299F91C5|nr:twin-arginine translocation signal domain-containing protein [Streptomyces sp. ME19-01-6]MDX3232010.1 twin-arginine translocation signal domain-containing protein [Streptomyces sp. ME19-01-6]